MRRRTYRGRGPAVAAMCLLGFAGLALTARAGIHPAADDALRRLALGWAGEHRVPAAAAASLLGSTPVILTVAVAAGAAAGAARRRFPWGLALAVSLAMVLDGPLKEWAGRPRPSGEGLGFPSGHALRAAACYGSVYAAAAPHLRPRARTLWRLAAGAAILAAGAARILLDLHWGTDVAGGWLLGLALAALLGRR